MNVVEMLEMEQMRSDIPDFKPGDTVKVYARIKEGEKERIQVFQGVVIRKRRGTPVPHLRFGKSLTVSVWNVFSPFTPPTLIRLRWCQKEKSEDRGFITSGICAAGPQESKKSDSEIVLMAQGTRKMMFVQETPASAST